MKLIQTEGLVTGSRSYSEADKLLTLFTLEKGKVPAIARGACKTKSKLAASVQLFTRGDYQLHMGKSLATVTQGEIKTSFYSLRYDLTNYAYGQYFCELVNRLLEEKEPFPEVYQLLLIVFEVLKNGELDMELLARSFELKMLSILGYRPYLERCLACSRDSNFYRLSFREGGILCAECSLGSPGSQKINPGTLSVLKKLLSANCSLLKILKVSSSQKKEILLINKKLLSYNVNLGSCKSLVFLEELGSLPKVT